MRKPQQLTNLHNRLHAILTVMNSAPGTATQSLAISIRFSTRLVQAKSIDLTDSIVQKLGRATLTTVWVTCLRPF
jgi:hypothetical protein